eukprot:TRINITY_DN23799_c0_g1_i1.p1 TRINITY_DN23799_c0_g1~~TRINITY_DN23799_c0_g1_i1.p1  ORF type:complete len:537 (-),score=108.05 TRINITY_DN23799_c0_g1_i1:117-1727(-)
MDSMDTVSDLDELDYGELPNALGLLEATPGNADGTAWAEPRELQDGGPHELGGEVAASAAAEKRRVRFADEAPDTVRDRRQLISRIRTRLSAVRSFSHTLASVRSQRDGASRQLPCRVWKSVRSASIECTRQMLVEVLRDGEVTESERRMLRAALVLFAQLERDHGDERVSMPNENRACQSVRDVYPDVADFIEKVAAGLERHIVQDRRPRRSRSRERDRSRSPRHELPPLDSSLIRSSTKTGLEWCAIFADTDSLLEKVSPEELLSFCEDEKELNLDDLGPLAGLCLHYLLALVPASYMLKSRLFEFYTAGSKINLSLLLMAARFFILSFLYAFCREWVSLVAYLMQWRVILCFARNVWGLGHIVYPLVFFAELITDWGSDHWLLGCSGKGKCILAWLPVSLARWLAQMMGSFTFIAAVLGVFFALGLLRLVPALRGRCEGCERRTVALGAACTCMFASSLDLLLGHALSEGTEPLLWALRSVLGPLAEATLDFLVTAASSQAVLLALEAVDEVIQPKLMLMSAKLGARARQLVT